MGDHSWVRTLKDLLGQAEVRCGGKRAVSVLGTQLPYVMLFERSHRLVEVMRSQGVLPGDRVALLAVNSFRYIEVSFACALAEVILVPLNIRLAPAELKAILEDVAARLLFCGSKLALEGIPTIRWDDAALPGEDCQYENMLKGAAMTAKTPERVRSEHIAQIYFTSGTSGKPKGVCLSHGNMVASTLDSIEALNLSDSDIWLHAAPMFHLVDAFAIWGMTLVGGGHVATHFDPATFGRVVEVERVTTSSLPPTLLDWISRQNPRANHDLSSLRLISYGGSPMQDAVYRRCRESLRCQLLQAYGLTEGAGFVCHELPGDNPDVNVPLNTVGRPVRRAQLALLQDADILPDDLDGTGEILLRGQRMFSQYWNNPLPNSTTHYNGWYRTGDVAERKAGLYRIVGRCKDMIITGGENVYPAEVINALLAHPAVAEAAVFGVPSEQWGEEVRAVVFCSSEEGEVPSTNELIRHCRALIGGYKTPKTIVFSDSPLPKTGAGKIAAAEVRAAYSQTDAVHITNAAEPRR